MRRWLKTSAGIPRSVVALVAFTGGYAMIAAFAPPAAAATQWSRTPASTLAGATVRVASSVDTLCQWVMPTPATTTTSQPAAAVEAPSTNPSVAPPDRGALRATATGDPIAYDGTTVEIRLETSDQPIPLGSVAVTPGGAWSGRVTVPDASVAIAGNYTMVAHCIVDNPQLDGVRSFDFDPLPFSIVDAPPPTTITLPTEIGEPLTATNPVQVEGAQVTRTAATTPAATGPTLPKTGDGTLAVALAGFGALLLGAAALWWGSRKLTPERHLPG